MNKERLENWVRRVGMKPALKKTFRGGEIFVADGKADNRTKASLLKRGAINLGEFPDGFYMTTWFYATGEDVVQCGPLLFFDVNHDKEQGWDDETKRRARINTAVAEARGFIESVERVKRDGV